MQPHEDQSRHVPEWRAVRQGRLTLRLLTAILWLIGFILTELIFRFLSSS